MRYSGPGVDSGYESGAGSSGQGVWMPHGSSYTGGSYPRQDRNPYDGAFCTSHTRLRSICLHFRLAFEIAEIVDTIWL